jgi:hypothetical protein
MQPVDGGCNGVETYESFATVEGQGTIKITSVAGGRLDVTASNLVLSAYDLGMSGDSYDGTGTIPNFLVSSSTNCFGFEEQ